MRLVSCYRRMEFGQGVRLASALPQKRNGKTKRVGLLTAMTDAGAKDDARFSAENCFWRRLLRDRRGVPDSGDLHVALYFSVWCRCPRNVRGVRGHISMDCFFVVTTGALAQRLIQIEGCCASGTEATSLRAPRIVQRTSDLGTIGNHDRVTMVN
jgi:hypothetical protein